MSRGDASGNPVVVAAVQMECELGRPEVNWATAERLVAEAAGRGAKVVVLPEFFATGYRLDEDYASFAESVPGPTTRRLAEWCSRYRLDLAVGCLVENARAQGVLFNTAVAVGSEGVVGVYRKVSLWGQERLFFRGGSELPVCRTPVGRLGMLICYDTGFPEVSRGLALAGADFLCVPAAFAKARLHAWDLGTRARALENGFYIVAANRVGTEKDSVYAGHSRIVAPDGSLLADIAEGEGLAMAEIDLAKVAAERRVIPYLRDLRPEFWAAYEGCSLCRR
jgi:predicted amidohydrolase